jgi:hypothetical protein
MPISTIGSAGLDQAANVTLCTTSGSVGIGTASPVNKLDVLGDVTPAGFYRNIDVTVVGTAGVLVNLGAKNGSTPTPGAAIGAILDNPATTGGMLFYIRSSNTLTERARIDSSGNLLVGTTSSVAKLHVLANAAVVDPVTVSNSDSGSGSQFAIVFRRNTSTVVGSIQTTNVATSYNTSSDYRLKENIAPMTGALAKVALLKPCVYKWKVDGSDGQGFIAHELAEVEAGCVTGEKDAVDESGNPKYQGIDTSFLVATLTAAIQELKAIVDAQAVEIAALKGQA